MAPAPDPAAVLSGALREDRGRIMAALLARVRDFDLAEEALQEAAQSALLHWARSGVPARPEAWLIRVAFRKAIDRLRQAARDDRRAATLAILARDEAEEPEMIADERLRLIFTCCHPALEPKTQVALTLRTICGLSTGEIARAFLDQEPAMAQRLSRAKARIAATGIAFRVPEPDEWQARLASVLAVIYLIFNAGYGDGVQGDRDLGGEAIFLAGLLNQLRPGEPEVEGALALMLLTHARRFARVGPDGASLPPAEQDRNLWDMPMLREGVGWLKRAFERPGAAGPHALKAAIAACHTLPEAPDWPQIRALYDALLACEPTDVIRLNRAVAMAETGQLAEALAALQALRPGLADYQPFHAALAELLLRSGQVTAAIGAIDEAVARATRPEDAVFLRKRRDAATQKRAGSEKDP